VYFDFYSFHIFARVFCNEAVGLMFFGRQPNEVPMCVLMEGLGGRGGRKEDVMRD
jgi:hypothetical protein